MSAAATLTLWGKPTEAARVRAELGQALREQVELRHRIKVLEIELQRARSAAGFSGKLASSTLRENKRLVGALCRRSVDGSRRDGE